MLFVILHGSFGQIGSNWFPYLKTELELIGQRVNLTQFPIDSWDQITMDGVHVLPKNQKLSNWFLTFEKNVLPDMESDVCFICHSVSCVFLLHLITKYNIKADSVIFVSPFLTKLNKSWQIDHVNNSFYKENFDWGKINKLLGTTYTLYSDDDPYVDSNFSVKFADYTNSSKLFVRSGKHFNEENGFTKFPLIFDLCTSRLNLNEINYLSKIK